MSNASDRLVEILERHRTHSEALLGLAEEKRSAIVSNAVQELDRITLAEMEHVGAIRRLEEDRKMTVEILGSRIGTRADAKLDDIAARLDDAERERLQAARGSLRTVLDRLRERNAGNKELLDASVSHFHGFFTALRNLRADRPVYDRRGIPSAGGRPLLDRTA